MDPHAIRVLLRNPEGLYLAGTEQAARFTPHPAEARVFDFLADQVAARIEGDCAQHGLVWTVVRADPRAGFETCDRCGRQVMAFKVVFDGRAFLCADCRSQAGA